MKMKVKVQEVKSFLIIRFLNSIDEQKSEMHAAALFSVRITCLQCQSLF